jgi:hypothetical protein
MASGSTHRRTRGLARKNCGSLVHTMRSSRSHAKNQRRQERCAILGNGLRTLKPWPWERRTGKTSPVREPLAEVWHQQLGPHRLPRREFNCYLCIAPDTQQENDRFIGRAVQCQSSWRCTCAVPASSLARSRVGCCGRSCQRAAQQSLHYGRDDGAWSWSKDQAEPCHQVGLCPARVCRCKRCEGPMMQCNSGLRHLMEAGARHENQVSLEAHESGRCGQERHDID